VSIKHRLSNDQRQSSALSMMGARAIALLSLPIDCPRAFRPGPAGVGAMP
jgi:hypothetical protein